VVWVDEAGFYLLGGVVHTYAPRGQTTVLRVPRQRDHLSVISGITPAGRLLVRIQERAFKGPHIVRFLKHLRVHLGDKLLVIWDGLPAHANDAVKRYLAGAAGEQIQVEQLPGYAPDLNPDEGVWDQLKYIELHNVTCYNQAELRYQLRRAIARLQHKPALIRRFIEHSGY
jgi:transposase